MTKEDTLAAAISAAEEMSYMLESEIQVAQESLAEKLMLVNAALWALRHEAIGAKTKKESVEAKQRCIKIIIDRADKKSGQSGTGILRTSDIHCLFY